MTGPFQFNGAIPDPPGSTHDEAPIETNVAKTARDFVRRQQMTSCYDDGQDKIEEVKDPVPLLMFSALPPEWGAHVVAGQKKSHRIARQITLRMLQINNC